MIASMRGRGTRIYGLWADVHGPSDEVKMFRQEAAVRWWKGSREVGQISLSFIPAQYKEDGISADPFILPEPLDYEETNFAVAAPCVAGDCGGEETIFTRVVAFLGGERKLREDVCLYFYAWPYPYNKSNQQASEKL